MSKETALQKSLVHARTIEGAEQFTRPRRFEVDLQGDRLLARARFAEDEHTRLRMTGNARNRLFELHQGSAGPDQLTPATAAIIVNDVPNRRRPVRFGRSVGQIPDRLCIRFFIRIRPMRVQNGREEFDDRGHGLRRFCGFDNIRQERRDGDVERLSDGSHERTAKTPLVGDMGFQDRQKELSMILRQRNAADPNDLGLAFKFLQSCAEKRFISRETKTDEVDSFPVAAFDMQEFRQSPAADAAYIRQSL